jgi:tetratricopeptide (TPR) repeat protein
MPQPSRGIAPGNPTSSIFISGKVTLDDGTDLAEPAAIQTICRGQRHTMTYTDRRGSFSFQFGDPNPSGSADMSDASSSMMTARASLQQSRDWQDCEVQAVLAGFSSDPVELTSRMSTLESTDVGRVVLHRLEHVDGTSISVTSILAPNPAKKALEKGREDEKKGKWDQAQQSFEKAVQIYPKYAAAWSELGQAQMHHNDAASAKHSFEQSVAADPKYVNPYVGLARMAFEANQWPDVLETTNKLLALNPVNFPEAYFFNGVANFHLKNLDAAEKSARQGLRVDDGHQFPKMEYLLGMILLQKADYPGATEHMTQYLHLATQPADVAVANNELAEIARLSAKPNSAAVTDKK